MAFLKFSRDRRGYEHFCLVEPTTRRGKTRPRVLYWFRTPPNIKVGREPFDADARRSLQQQNPGVTFDWRRILETPVPSAEVEMWRERRRSEKSARRAAVARRVERETDEAPDDEVVVSEAVPEIAPSAVPPVDDDQNEQARRRRRHRRRGRSRGAQGGALIASPSGASSEPEEPSEPSEHHDLGESRGSIDADSAGKRREHDESVESSDPTSDQ